MSVTDTTAPAQTAALSFEFDLAHPPAKVWRALTDPALLSQWLLPTIGFKLEVGQSFTHQAPPVGGWDGIVSCRVKEFVREKKLVYEWTVPGLDTVASFTLTPTSNGTKLVVVQSGFREDQKKNWGGARYGWRMMGGRLVDLLGRAA